MFLKNYERGEGSRNVEITCHHDHQGVHPQIKGVILLQVDKSTGFYQDGLLPHTDHIMQTVYSTPYEYCFITTLGALIKSTNHIKFLGLTIECSVLGKTY
jgi:hypothetical protein